MLVVSCVVPEERFRGCSILFLNGREEILLYLRDDKPGLPEAGKWDLIGGKVEAGETPEEGIRREVQEELGVREGDITSRIRELRPFKQYDFQDREENVFWCALDVAAKDLLLFEGQRLGWFSRIEISALEIGFGFKGVIEDFFSAAPFRQV